MKKEHFFQRVLRKKGSKGKVIKRIKVSIKLVKRRMRQEGGVLECIILEKEKGCVEVSENDGRTSVV